MSKNNKKQKKQIDMELKFRNLKANELECRVARVYGNKAQFLIYKDARIDMKLLDEVVGAMNWKREHTRDNANCIVSIWDNEKSQWISKEDTGNESRTEAQKGLASDSFKRACFNWGIGRELYSAPYIMIEKIDEDKADNIKVKCSLIEYNKENEISKLVLVDYKGRVRYQYVTDIKQATKTIPNKEEGIKAIIEKINNSKNVDELNTLKDQVIETGRYTEEMNDGGILNKKFFEKATVFFTNGLNN